jgi:hypothetical protein
MTNIKRARRPIGLRGYMRRALPLVALLAATMLAGCVYPYPGHPYRYGYYHPHPYYYGGGWH